MHPVLTQRRQKIRKEKISFHDSEIEKNLDVLIELCQSKLAADIPGLKEVGESLVCYAELLKKYDPQTNEGRKLRSGLKEGMEQLKSALAQKLQNSKAI